MSDAAGNVVTKVLAWQRNDSAFFISNKSLGGPFKPSFGLSGVVADPPAVHCPPLPLKLVPKKFKEGIADERSNQSDPKIERCKDICHCPKQTSLLSHT
jgi:hypothetical protein